MLEQSEALLPIQFPYVPGLLSFRETPVAVKALEKLTRTPDVILCDGQGLAHRFYHQSFKVFGAIDEIKQAKELFEKIAPDSVQLNKWFYLMAEAAISKNFDFEKTNKNWFEETRPILEAFWHCKYFLEQMIIAADGLEESPNLLPSGWAAVLYLYNLR